MDRHEEAEINLLNCVPVEYYNCWFMPELQLFSMFHLLYIKQVGKIANTQTTTIVIRRSVLRNLALYKQYLGCKH